MIYNLGLYLHIDIGLLFNLQFLVDHDERNTSIMKIYIKSAIDESDITSEGISSMVQDNQTRDDVINLIISKLNNREMLSTLEDNLEEDEFIRILVILGQAAIE